MNDALDEPPKEFNALKKVRLRISRIEFHFGTQCAEKSIRVSDVAHTVHLRVFSLRRALQFGDVLQKAHEALYESLKKRHHYHKRDSRKASHEQPDLCQIRIDRNRV